MNAYETLGISQNATSAQIVRAYQQLYQRYNVFTSAPNVERFMEINAAYALLSHPPTRNRLDQSMGFVGTFNKDIIAPDQSKPIVQRQPVAQAVDRFIYQDNDDKAFWTMLITALVVGAMMLPLCLG